MSSHLVRALAVTPNASQTRSKAPGAVGPRFGPGEATKFPLFAIGGLGAYVRDNRGRRYLDLAGANGAIPLGYASPGVVSAVQQAICSGSLFSLPHVFEAEVSEKFIGICAPWAHQVRWVRTGSEATHAALRIAQAATGRRAYLRLRGSYHGWHSCWQDNAQDAPDARWMDLHGVAPGTDLIGQDIAAVFIEPPRWQEINVGWLRAVIAQAHIDGALVVFDEMIYGLRWAKGGSAEHYDLDPDLACFGKALGNGVPIACVCGPTHLMRHATACVSGTYGGDMLGLSAAGAVLDIYKTRDVIGELWANGRALCEGFAASAPPSALLQGTPVHWRLAMPDPDALDRALAACADDGLLVHRDANNSSAAMTQDEAREAGRRLGRACEMALEAK